MSSFRNNRAIVILQFLYNREIYTMIMKNLNIHGNSTCVPREVP